MPPPHPALTADQVRRAFIDFFRGKPGGAAGGHTFVPSSPCVPHDDPTLLFTNAGMNQFKPIFLGNVDPASPMGKLRRAVNSQKCIRAGGKHNDLDDVGKDTYHHTFFEMLGNWSFGDYFKKEAIEWSWELLTQVFKIPGDRLYATYFKGNPEVGLEPDEETRELWRRFLPPARVLPGNMKDNFWEMGETGPCGPCTEIHYDRIGSRDAAKLVNAGDPDVLEIWNNVFIQFNREPGAPGQPGKLRILPAKHVDTGMGLERLVSVLQNKRSNYDTDVFSPIFVAIQKVTGARPYQGKLGAADTDNIDTAYRVIADHIRTLTFAITDGATPSNEGRGYVLRRILRRAVRYGRQMMNARTGFFSELVPTVVERMGAAFPELRKSPLRVQAILLEEEESFGRTLDRGIKLFEDATHEAGLKFHDQRFAKYQTSDAERYAKQYLHAHNVRFSRGYDGVDWRGFVSDSGDPAEDRPIIPAEDAFKLADTYGFPIDLTQQMAEERGLRVDIAGYESLMEQARERSRAGGKQQGGKELALGAEHVARLRHMDIAPTDDVDKFHGREVAATVLAIFNGDNFDDHIRAGAGGADGLGLVGIILDKSNFYAEMGGQVFDTGRLTTLRETRAGNNETGTTGEFKVESVRAFGGYVLHIGRLVRGEVRVGDGVSARIDQSRRAPVAANHTATHLLNFGLRRVLGAHVDQKGSLVAPDRLRFDFSNTGPPTPEQLEKVEAIVRDLIRKDLTVYADVAPLAAGKQIAGLRAVFGEAYPDPVRIVSIGQPISELLASPGNPAWSEVSVEFCGGTHLERTGLAESFAITAEEAVAKGIRRVTAITGVAAKAALRAADVLDERVSRAAALDAAALPADVAEITRDIESMPIPLSRKARLRAHLAQLQEKLKSAGKQAAQARAAQAAQLARQIAESATISGDEVIISTIDAGSERAALESAVKTIRDKCPRSAVMLFSTDESDAAAPRVTIMAGIPDTLVKRGLNAGEWIRETAAILGGKGGGRPDAAQGGGTQVGKVKEAIAAARSFAARTLM
jgi:alanyl-tRNA synthetase